MNVLIRKQIIPVLTVMMLLLSYTLPSILVASASTTFSVGEAIASNEGSATVEGYIVGVTTNGPTYQQSVPYSTNTNIAIADSPDEKDPAKIVPVQLPSSPSTWRETFGLQSNPEILGEKVVVTGTLQAYFGVPGIKNLTAISFAGEEPESPEEPIEPGEPTIEIDIHDIQGESHISPYVNQSVSNVDGIVTYVVDKNNFYVQDLEPDQHPTTSEGVLVYKTNHSVNVGDIVSLSGQVKEWILDGYSDRFDTDLSMTEISASSINVISSENELPEAIQLGKDIFAPTTIIDNDQFGTFDPEEDALDFYESIEGMLVSLENPMVTGPQKYGEVPVITSQVEGKAYTKEGTPILSAENENPEKLLMLLDDRSYVVKAGDQFNGKVTGVISYSYTNYKLLVSTPDLPALDEAPYSVDVSTIDTVDKELTIASYNIENFHAGDSEKLEKIAKSIVENLKTPDIIGVVEMQDDSGGTDDAIVVAEQNYKALSEKIASLGGPTYHWTEVVPDNNMDGGAPGGNIRVGFMYNPERVSLKKGVPGDASTAVEYKDGSLTVNPGRIEPTNSAFDSSRKPLAAEFMFGDEEVIVIANHFNSKRGDQGSYGKNQPPTLGSVPKREEIATIINTFVTDIHNQNPEANVVVVGDLNDFEFSTSLQTLKGDVLTNLVEKLPKEERYTYIYQGNAQVLDHILVSNHLAEKAEIDIVNINSPFMKEHGRASDHDPLVTQLDFSEEMVEEDFDLSIFHTNDTHSHVEQYPYLISALKELRDEKPNALLLDGGDVFSGTVYFRQFLGQADAYFRNLAGYDAMTFGNHEFDKDSGVLGEFIQSMNFPIVSTNVDVSNDPILSQLYEEKWVDGETGKIVPTMLKEVDGEKVGIIGLTTEETTNLSSPSENIVFLSAVESAEKAIANFENEGVTKIIALSHLGQTYDIELANAVDGIDVIVGGHSHTLLEDAVVVEKEEPTLIVQAGDNLKYLGTLDVTFNPEGVVTDFFREVVELENFEKDSATEEKVLEFKEEVESLGREIVGHTNVVLDGERGDVRTKETNLGNLITDAMVAKANEVGSKTHIAFQNGGGIRASIDAGDITLEEVLDVMPFGNQLVTMDLTGQELFNTMEHSVSGIEAGEGRFLQVSGLKIQYDVAKAPGERVVAIQVKTDEGYAPLQLEQVYTVATNAFLAGGGDGYEVLKAAKEDGRMNDLYIVDWEYFTEYLAQQGSVSPVIEGRIVEGEEQEPILEIVKVKEKGKWYFYDQYGNPVIGWISYENETYYTDDTGEAKTKWFRESGNRYYFNKDGIMQIGWVKINGSMYYFDNSGVKQIGPIKSKWVEKPWVKHTILWIWSIFQ